GIRLRLRVVPSLPGRRRPAQGRRPGAARQAR
ncbi:MAG: hypothetical protein AVDCRST_MAG64-3029, partial [uncultured Phycisphaerae bacterium]